MNDTVLVEIADHVATVTLNRPKALNSLDGDMVEGLVGAMLRLERDDDVRCVILKGAGDHFMAGGDIKMFAGMTKLDAEARRSAFRDAFFPKLHPGLLAMRRMPKPIVASVRGACAGFGVSLAMACDLTLAAESAYFTLAYVRIGACPDGSSTFFLPRLVGLKRAMEIALLGDQFDARTAAGWGLINRAVADTELDAETAALAGRLAAGPRHALANAKALLYASADNPLEKQLEMEAAAFGDCAATPDWLEGVAAFCEKRPPSFG